MGRCPQTWFMKKKWLLVDKLDAISCSASQISNKDVMSDHLSSCVNSVVVREKSLNRPKRGNELDLGKQFWLWKQDKLKGKGDKLTNSLFTPHQIRNKMRKTCIETEWGFLSYFVKRETFCLVTFVIKNFYCFILRLKSVTDFGLLGRYIVFQMLFYIFCVKVTFCGVKTITRRKREPNCAYTYLVCLLILFLVRTSFSIFFAETSKLK